MFKSAITAVALTVALASGSSAATVVFSDNFNAETLGAPQGSLTNWSVTSGTVDVIGATGFYDFYPGNGRYLDMNGTPGGGRIQTAALGLVLGQTYKLSFNYGNNANSNGIEELSFGLGTRLMQLAIIGATAWSSFTASFIYDGSGDFLSFADTGTQSPNDNGGPIIDNVSLAAVPVPAAGFLLLGALGGLAALRRRKALAF